GSRAARGGSTRTTPNRRGSPAPAPRATPPPRGGGTRGPGRGGRRPGGVWRGGRPDAAAAAGEPRPAPAATRGPGATGGRRGGEPVNTLPRPRSNWGIGRTVDAMGQNGERFPSDEQPPMKPVGQSSVPAPGSADETESADDSGAV